MARGEAHEAAVLERFRAVGWQRRGDRRQDRKPTPRRPRWQPSATAPTSCTRACCWLTSRRTGRPCSVGPDFLVRAGLLPAPDGEPRPAGPHYEVVDAKLARSAKARAVAQVGFYSDLLAGAQGIRPRWMHLALGDGEFTSLRVDDYAAYERQARRLLAAFVADDDGENPPSVPYPEPVEHCVICRWSAALRRAPAARRRPVADRRDHRGAAPRAEGRGRRRRGGASRRWPSCPG